MVRKLLVVALTAGTAVFTLMLLLTDLSAVQAGTVETTVLYDGALGGRPRSEEF